jgi:hypothetical protein
MKSLVPFLAYFFLLFFSISALGQSKTEVFNIGALGMNVGTITVNQQIDGDRLVVEAISQVEVRIVFKFKVKYIQTSIYEKGELVSSSLKTYKKGVINSDTRLTKKGSGYGLEKDGEKSYINDRIYYSGSLLYFHEPISIKNLYFEINGEKTSIENAGLHKYLITDPHNGKKNEYTYKNGVLKQAIIKHSMANVYLTLKE